MNLSLEEHQALVSRYRTALAAATTDRQRFFLLRLLAVALQYGKEHYAH